MLGRLTVERRWSAHIVAYEAAGDVASSASMIPIPIPRRCWWWFLASIVRRRAFSQWTATAAAIGVCAVSQPLEFADNILQQQFTDD